MRGRTVARLAVSRRTAHAPPERAVGWAGRGGRRQVFSGLLRRGVWHSWNCQSDIGVTLNRMSITPIAPLVERALATSERTSTVSSKSGAPGAPGAPVASGAAGSTDSVDSTDERILDAALELV